MTLHRKDLGYRFSFPPNSSSLFYAGPPKGEGLSPRKWRKGPEDLGAALTFPLELTQYLDIRQLSAGSLFLPILGCILSFAGLIVRTSSSRWARGAPEPCLRFPKAPWLLPPLPASPAPLSSLSLILKVRRPSSGLS